MSDDILKADQIAFHFYTKLFYALHDARATEGTRPQSKTDKWFNLETPDCDLFTKDARDPYKNISMSPAPGPPVLEIQVLLAVPELSNNQVLVYAAPDTPRVKVEPARRFILLEEWNLGMDFHNHRHAGAVPVDVTLPTIYKHGIVLFRSLYSLLRVLPAWKFYKRLKRRTGGVIRNGNLSIQLRVRSPGAEDDNDLNILRFNVPPAPSHLPLPTDAHTFPPIPHLLGAFTLSATYLTAPHFFQLDEREALLSSGFLSFDKHFSSTDRQQGEGFLPTLERHRQRDSITGSGVSAFGAPMTRSPPKPIGVGRTISTGGGVNPNSGVERDNVAERFIIPSRVASIGAPTLGMGTSAITGSSALIPPPRPFPMISTNTNTSIPTNTTTSQTTSPAHPTYTTPAPGLAQRLRRESLTSSTSSSTSARDHVPPSPFNTNVALPSYGGTNSLSSSPSTGVPIRRPGIHPVHPFKGNTLSSAGGSSPSLSIRQGVASSPGGLGMPSSLGRDVGGSAHSRHASFSSSGMQNSPILQGARLPSVATGSNAASGTAWPSSPGHATTFAPSSLGAPARAGATMGGRGLSMERDEGRESDPERARRRSVQGTYGYHHAAESREPESELGRPQPVPVPMPPRRRYESSFGHRYAGSGGSGTSGAAPGSGDGGRGTPASVQSQDAFGARTSPRPRSATHSSTNSTSIPHDHDEDKEISIFVQDIDDRKPLSGRTKEQNTRHPLAHARQSTDGTVKGKERAYDNPESPSAGATNYASGSPTTVASPTSPALPGAVDLTAISPRMAAAQLSTSPQRGPMLTTESEIDARLRRMNETFLRSLEGISGGSTRRKNAADTADAADSNPDTGRPKSNANEEDAVIPVMVSESATSSGSGSGSGQPSLPASTSTSSEEPAAAIPPEFPPGARLGGAYLPRPALSEQDSPNAPSSPYEYFSPTSGLGLGLPPRARIASTSSSTLATSEAGASQGSEEVIGRMELDGERRRWGYGP